MAVWLTALSALLLVLMAELGKAADLNRQAIIFNEKTPGVFYCPQVGAGVMSGVCGCVLYSSS